MPEVGSTETIHFKMLPYKNLYVMGQRKFVGSLPKRIALKSNYELNYHITVGNGLIVWCHGNCFMNLFGHLKNAQFMGSGSSQFNLI